MDNDLENNINPEGQNDPKKMLVWWNKISQYNLNDLRQRLLDLQNTKPDGKSFKAWFNSNGQKIVETYAAGILLGHKTAPHVNLNEYSIYVYLIENNIGNLPVVKTQEEQKKEKPSPLVSSDRELDDLYKEEKINKEIDDLLGM